VTPEPLTPDLLAAATRIAGSLIRSRRRLIVQNGVCVEIEPTITEVWPDAIYEARMQAATAEQRARDAASLAATFAGRSPAEAELIDAERQRFLAERGADTHEVRAAKIADADARLERAERAVLAEQSLSEAAE
jgi:hypothetical protein